MKRIHTYAVFALFILAACKQGANGTASATAPGSTAATTATSTADDEVVLHVNSQPVTLGEFNAAVDSLPANKIGRAHV